MLMKTLLAVAGSLAWAILLSAQAQAQTPTPAAGSPAPTRPTPKTASKRAAAYKGPKVVKDTKALGDRMIRDSKPDTRPVMSPSPK